MTGRDAAGHGPSLGCGQAADWPLSPVGRFPRLMSSATRRPPLRPSWAYPSLPSWLFRASPPLRPSWA